ncbi:quinone oxidoreductase family protein [Paenibacillus flagellatus]|uniref:NADP-dependent oxidoreductase n=1 Tax=Paenibacillus flagellatus TaxID=2211139 RepID=A0A2V5KHV1_9BACL|nr:NADP-dependent oxidoreductase [Paenibacillus flagellatus]PYI53950.1 NADP-dependent oxidoreductase [Paenibacillus flagellatus]
MNKPPNTMRAVVLQKFGGPDELVHREIAVPELGPEEVLIRVAYAGVGEWDAFEREGGYADMLNMRPQFPYVLGSEGSGTVVARGEKVSNVDLGEPVYASAFLNPKGGFYAEYAAVPAKYVTRMPEGLTMREAAVISGVGITALRGLEDVLALRQGESILIFGAGGGVGHMAVQLAKCLGARVFGVASGEDGVAMVKRLGCDAVANGREGDFLSKAFEFAPEGFDAALFTAGGEAADAAAGCLRPGGRIAFPHGIRPSLGNVEHVRVTGYYGEPDPDIMDRLRRYISRNRLTAHISHTIALKDAREAHAVLSRHYLGKISLQVNP